MENVKGDNEQKRGVITVGIDRIPSEPSRSMSPLGRDVLAAVLNCMVEVNRMILESYSFESVLERVLDTVRKVVGAEGAALLLYDEETQCLELQQPAFGFYDDRLVQLYRVSPMEDTIAARVFNTGEPFISNNVPGDPRFIQRVAPIVGTRNNLSVPVVVGNRCIGVFHVVNKPEGFTERDKEVVTWLVSQLAVAVANARLLCRVKAQEQRARALYELAMEINLRDPEGVARLVVQKVCSVLRFPLAAVALAVSEDEGRVVAEAGFGSGVVGRVVALGPGKEELKDLEQGNVDSLAQEALRLGMVTQLSVPIPPDTGRLGRLWVWEGHRRLIRPSERQFVSLVAHLLGMAVQNAFVYQREREIARRLDRYLRFNQQLVRLVLENAGIQRITAVVARFLGARVVFSDHRLVKRAWAPEDSSELRELDLSFVCRASIPSATLPPGVMGQRESPRGDSEAVVAPVEAGGRLLGYLIVLTPVAGVEEVAPVINLVTPVYALEMLKEQIVSEVRQSLGEDFIGGLLDGRYSDDEAQRRAANLGYRFGGPVVAMVAEPVRGSQEGAHEFSWRGYFGVVQNALERLEKGAVATIMQGKLVMIVPCSSLSQLRLLKRLRSLASALRQELMALAGMDVYVGVGRVVQTLAQVSTSYRDACFTLDYLRRVSPGIRVLAFSELGIYQVLACQGASDYIMEYVYELLGPVLDMDRKRGTEYLKTLDCYYATGGSLKGAADALCCHVNTVRYRLERIQKLLPLELDSVEHRLTLQMALGFLKLRHPELF